MHLTSLEKMTAFVDVHLNAFRGTPLQVLDFGSQTVNDSQARSYRDLLDDAAWTYRGVDIEAGRNVDIVLADPYCWSEVEADSADLVVSGQAFEHVRYVWASMFEIARAQRPGGVAAIIAPSSGYEHRFPVDCWRFYPDGFAALAEYVGCEVVDVFTDWGNDTWQDSILVARKPVWNADERAVFARRLALQRELSSGAASSPPGGSIADGEPQASPLTELRVGALAAALTAAADRRIAESTVAIAPTPAVAAPVVASLPARLYGAVRMRIAAAAGTNGRALYKRLRGRR
jgi:SAM-dependent methyltransferase